MEGTVKDRLIAFIKSLGISTREFERRIGVKNSYISHLIYSPSNGVLESIFQQYPNLRRVWLLTGEGKMLVGDGEEYPRMSDNYNEGKPFYDVPFTMGYDLPFNDNTSNPTCMIDFRPYNKCDFWCRATGDSMYPTISDGDIVAVKRVYDFASSVISNDIYAIVLCNDLRAIKRLVDKGDTFILVSDNKEYEPQIVNKSDVRFVYRVMGSLKMKMF